MLFFITCVLCDVKLVVDMCEAILVFYICANHNISSNLSPSYLTLRMGYDLTTRAFNSRAQMLC